MLLSLILTRLNNRNVWLVHHAGTSSQRIGHKNLLTAACGVSIYGDATYMKTPSILDREVKRGSAEMLILALVEDRPRHGYEIAKLIEQRSDGVLQFHVASLYPLLYRLEKRGLILGHWVERPNQRRRRFYKLTKAGQEILKEHRLTWKEFFAALDRVAGINPA